MTHSAQITVPLVGAHFRPPAKALLAVLHMGCPLTLEAEPTNPYDDKAIMVWLDTKDIRPDAHEALTTTLAGFGFTLNDVLALGSIHLGYVARIETAPVHELMTGPYEATLTSNAKGSPAVRICRSSLEA